MPLPTSEYTCNKTVDGICELSSISIDTANYYFQSKNSTTIHTLTITNSNVTFLSKNLCYHFSNLLKLSAKTVSLQFIPVAAFETCLAIKAIDLSNNLIKEIADGTFAGLKHLSTLNLYNNEMRFFDPEVIKGSTGIEQLALVSNHLLDLDEEKLVKYLPRLKTVYLNDNEFPCDRVKAIREVFLKKNVAMSRITILEKQRGFEMESMDDMSCMTRGSWTRRLKSDIIHEALKVMKEDEAFPTMIKESLNDHSAKMEDIEAVKRRNDSDSMLKQMADKFDILNATFTEHTKSHNNTLNSHLVSVTNSSHELLLKIDAIERSNDILNRYLTNVTSASNEFLLKIDVLERRNAVMQHTIVLHTQIMYGTIGSIIILLVFCLAFVVHYRICRCRSRTPRDTSPTHQLSLETNVCRL